MSRLIFELLFSHFSEGITTDICILKNWVLISSIIKISNQESGMVFLLTSWVIYSDHYYGSLETSGGEKAALSVEPFVYVLSYINKCKFIKFNFIIYYPTDLITLMNILAH